MAAPMKNEKFTKSERKLLKKQAKSQHTLKRHEGIETVNYPSSNLFIGNAGLGNGITRSEVVNIFQPFGQIKDVIMVIDKPYAFVCYEDKDAAMRAHKEINGKPLKCPEEVSSDGLKFYTAFIKDVPGSQCGQTQSFPPGLVLLPDFIDQDLEQRLIGSVQWDDTDPERSLGECDQKSLKHRRVKHYGYEFIYGINNVDPEKPLPQGIPSECDEVLDKILQLGYVKKRPDQLTVNQYIPGQGIPPHIDTHSAFEDGIISLSTGGQVIMDFRHPSGTHIPVVLPPRSLLIMTGESRYLWTHGITPRKTDIVETEDAGKGLTLAHRETRTSFTFRILRRAPCHCEYPEQCDSQMDSSKPKKRNILPQTDTDAAAMETKLVHEVYEEIACHFSDTRHSPWPRVAEFLKALPTGSLVVDVGCGNGKYLGVNKNLYMVGNDRSFNLSSVCQERGFQVFVCDCLSIPLRPNSCDACICIAVIHHLSTKERRLAAVKEIVSLLRVGGKALIYVWAFEQELNKVKSNYLKESRMKKVQKESNSGGNGNVGKQQEVSDCAGKLDELKLRTSQSDFEKTENEAGFTQTSEEVKVPTEGHDLECRGHSNGSLETACEGSSVASSPGAVGGKSGNAENMNSATDSKMYNAEEDTVPKKVTDSVVADGVKPKHYSKTQSKDCDNEFGANKKDTNAKKDSSLLVHVNRTKFEKQDVLVPWHKKDVKSTEEPEKVYHRFYHVFREGELEDLCREVSGVEVEKSYYDKGNWCVVFVKNEK